MYKNEQEEIDDIKESLVDTIEFYRERSPGASVYYNGLIEHVKNDNDLGSLKCTELAIDDWIDW